MNNMNEISSIKVIDEPKGIDTLLTLFERVASEQGWQPGNQMRYHTDNSIFFAAYVNGKLAGGLQLVIPDDTGLLPSHAVWPDVDLTVSKKGGHVAVLALLPEYRGSHDLFWKICVEMWRYCVTTGMEPLTLEVTPSMLNLYRKIGFPLKVVGDLREHWGEPCYLTRLDILDVAGTLLIKAVKSTTYKRLVMTACRSEALPEGHVNSCV